MDVEHWKFVISLTKTICNYDTRLADVILSWRLAERVAWQMAKLCVVVLLKCWFKSVAMIVFATMWQLGQLCSQAVFTPVENK